LAQIKLNGSTIAEAIELIDDPSRAPWISPGWIDLQVNGYAGFDFNKPDTSAADFAGVTQAMWRRGVTRYYPTIITASRERISASLHAYREYMEGASKEERWTTPGIHLEGPYLSGEEGPRGAHPGEHIRDPDWDEFEEWQRICGRRIRLVTIAPEREGAIPFIRRLTESGVTVSIGHTAASGAIIREAVRAGATMSTHLGNGAHPLLPRHPNYIWEQLGEDALWATLIPDGHHVRPNVLQSMMRAKQGRFIFVSDVVRFGGAAPGVYRSDIGDEVVLSENGALRMQANPALLAGSVQALNEGIETVLKAGICSLADAMEAVTIRPASALQLAETPALSAGAPASLTLFRYPDQAGGLSIEETFVAGKSVYRRASP
jgi:N-acetylglucosamine-6-phosphate deacetylase